MEFSEGSTKTNNYGVVHAAVHTAGMCIATNLSHRGRSIGGSPPFLGKDLQIAPAES